MTDPTPKSHKQSTDNQNHIPAREPEHLAKRYVEMPWSLLSILKGTKKPAEASWKHRQTTRAGLDEVLSWIELGRGLAVVLGDISDGWVVRDFDDPESYRRWATAFPDAANVLPTSITARGYHVFVQDHDVTKTITFDDGELRSNGSYVLVPPSLHPDTGKPYQWKREPWCVSQTDSFGPFSVSECQLDRSWKSGVTESAESTENTQSTQMASVDSVHCVDSVTVRPDADQISEAIASTVPHGIGKRNNGLFRFARRLQAILGRKPTAEEVKQYAMMWYEQAKDRISTLDPLITVADLQHAVDSVKIPDDGNNVVQHAWMLSLKLDKPWFADAYDGETAGVRLARLVVAMDVLMDGGTWFLSCHQAGDLIETSHKQAYRLLMYWVRNGILKLVEPGIPGHPGSKANRYRLVKQTEIRSEQDNG